MPAPLLTFVIINWNYGKYIESAILSIKNQVYENFECIIVDNASEDASVNIAQSAIAGDERFKIIARPSNAGQLGAFLDVFSHLNGEFVSIVDADDYLLPSYATFHLQLHHACSPPLGATSSNLIEIFADGAITSGGHAFHRRSKTPEVPVLTAENLVEGFDPDEFARLTEATIRFSPKHQGWLWLPGTSNMFRRSTIEKILILKPRNISADFAADNFLLLTCHLLAGTAIIDMPLSVYRIHGENDGSQMPSLRGFRGQRREATERSNELRNGMCAAVLRNREALRSLIGDDRFWSAADQLLRAHSQDRNARYASQIIRDALEEQLADFVRQDGLFGLLRKLRERMFLIDILRCLAGGLRRTLRSQI